MVAAEEKWIHGTDVTAHWESAIYGCRNVHVLLAETEYAPGVRNLRSMVVWTLESVYTASAEMIVDAKVVLESAERLLASKQWR